MKVFRHNHVSDNDELISTADLFENLEEQVAAFRGEVRTAAIATAGNEMQMSGLVTAMQVARHGARVVPSGPVVCDG